MVLLTTSMHDIAVTSTPREKKLQPSYLLDTLANFRHSVGIRIRSLQKPAVSSQHLAPLIPRELDETIASVNDRIVGHLRVRDAEARLAGLERLDKEESALV